MEPIQVPSAGVAEWRGTITRQMLVEIVGGLKVPSQALAKAMARQLLEARDAAANVVAE